MKLITFNRLHLALLSSIIIMGACSYSSDESSDETALDSLLGPSVSAPVDDLNSDQSELFDLALGAYDDGVVRGIALGDNIDQVKAKESFKLFEELPNSVGYSIDTEQLETIDVVYHYNDRQKVNQIGIDIYLNSEASMNDLWNKVAKKLLKVYPQTNQMSDLTVQLKGEKGRVVIEKIVEDLDHGLKLTFEPIQ